MLPICVFADSDIDEEELKPVLLKLKKKLRKANKKLGMTADVCIDVATNSSLDPIPDDSSTTSWDSFNSTDVPLKNPNKMQEKCVAHRIKKKSRKRKREEIEDVTRTEESAYQCPLCGIACYTSILQEKRRYGEIGCTCKSSNTNPAVLDSQVLISPQSSHCLHPERIVALDCEFVGVGPKKLSALGRCSIVNYQGDLILDIYAYPDEPITDYRTPWSGIRKRDMVSAVPFDSARNTILNILKDKIVVGHAVFNDFKVLKLSHPVECVRDTFSYKPLRQRSSALGHGFSLKKLAKALLGREIQTGEHCSYEDARAALDLYKLVQLEWEEKLSSRLCKNNKIRTEISLNCDTLFLKDEFWPSSLNEASSI